MNCRANEILQGLYLGSLLDARNVEHLKTLNISHIVSLLDGCNEFLPAYQVLPYSKKQMKTSKSDTGLFTKFKSLFKRSEEGQHNRSKDTDSSTQGLDLFHDKYYLCVKAEDSERQNLSQFFSVCNDFIHEARLNGNNVLVHCLAGVSRSASIICAYLMTTTDLDMDQALKMIRARRVVANPNAGFQNQLRQFEALGLQAEKERLNKKFSNFPLKEIDDHRCKEIMNLLKLEKEGSDGSAERVQQLKGLFNFSIMYPPYERKSQRKPSRKLSGFSEGKKVAPNVYMYSPETADGPDDIEEAETQLQ